MGIVQAKVGVYFAAAFILDLYELYIPSACLLNVTNLYPFGERLRLLALRHVPGGRLWASNLHLFLLCVFRKGGPVTAFFVAPGK